MATEAAKTHPWHVPEPSPWPIVGTIAGFVMAVGGIWYMHEGPIWLLAVGFAILLFTFYGWWRQVIIESNTAGLHSEQVKIGLRYGVIFFIVSEVMFFFAFFWAYFHSSLPILSNAAVPWPPADIELIPAGGVPLLNTLILLTSSATVTVAHHALVENDRSKAIRWTYITAVLGVVFLFFQAEEYIEATFKLSDGIYPSTFYLATGFHGFHVLVGTCFLFVCAMRLQKGHFTPDHHIGYEAAAWYWHFVDVVWIFLYINIYIWGAASFGHITPG
jgi:cytochrome c oxidase subunit III